MQTEILLSSIDPGTRERNDKKYGDLDSLKESLQSLGTIHPIVLSRSNGSFILVAGGRRLRALTELGIERLYHGSTLNPERPGFLFEDEVPEDVRKEAELDENLHRLDMDWIDQTLLIDKVHQLKSKKSLRWGTRHTAKLLGGTATHVKVAYANRIAARLREGDEELLNCKSFSEAVQYVVKREEDRALAELQRRVTPAPTKIAGFDLSSIFETTETETVKKDLPKAHSEDEVSISALPQQTVVPLSEMFRLGDCLSVMREYSDGFFHHVITDIPYGIDMDNLDEKQVASVKDTHDVDQNVGMMRPFLEQAFRLVRPGGFCVFFYDLDHHEKLQAWARNIGWKVQRWPCIAHKTSRCRNQAAQFNTTKDYEVFMLLRRDATSVLRSPVIHSVKDYDFAAERELYNNPFAKPFALWKDIYDMVSIPGQKILDPYCGECSSSRAAANCGLVPYGIEISETHLNRGLNHMRAVYALIHSSNVQFT